MHSCRFACRLIRALAVAKKNRRFGAYPNRIAQLQVKIRRERLRELKLIAGERVFIQPRRFDLFSIQLH
jgi:hypothetical protein